MDLHAFVDRTHQALYTQLPEHVELTYDIDSTIREPILKAPGNLEKNAVFLTEALQRESSFSHNALFRGRELRGIVFGAGSIGGATFLNLIRFGVASNGGLAIVDPEVHELSNLPRQATDALLLERANLNKAITTLILGLRQNPYHRCAARPHAATADNIDYLLEGQDFAIMGIDASRPDLLVRLIQSCDRKGIPLFGGLDVSTLRIAHTMLPGHPSLIRDSIHPDKIAALAKGELHPLGWLATMARVEYVPAQFFEDLRRIVTGAITWIPQSRIASEPQAIHTVANIINYFAGDLDRVPAFTAQDLIIGAYQPGDPEYEREKQRKIAFATSKDQANRTVIAMLGIDVDDYLYLLDHPRRATIITQ
jgi:hypothetical protein